MVVGPNPEGRAIKTVIVVNTTSRTSFLRKSHVLSFFGHFQSKSRNDRQVAAPIRIADCIIVPPEAFVRAYAFLRATGILWVLGFYSITWGA
jgi:hypothetical protein